jgi:FkbM family methyltransferase
MNIQTIAEHLVPMDLLKPKSWILDIGCYGWHFYKHMRSLGHEVRAVDIQHLSEFPYHRVALTDHNGHAFIEYSHDKQATRITEKETPYPIKCETLEEFTKHFCLNRWNMIKCDCEGSEREIIMSMTRPMADILEVEFHLHTGIYSEDDVKKMVYHLVGLGYQIVSHEKTSQHGLAPNYWSSLFVLQ